MVAGATSVGTSGASQTHQLTHVESRDVREDDAGEALMQLAAFKRMACTPFEFSLIQSLVAFIPALWEDMEHEVADLTAAAAAEDAAETLPMSAGGAITPDRSSRRRGLQQSVTELSSKVMPNVLEVQLLNQLVEFAINQLEARLIGRTQPLTILAMNMNYPRSAHSSIHANACVPQCLMWIECLCETECVFTWWQV